MSCLWKFPVPKPIATVLSTPQGQGTFLLVEELKRRFGYRHVVIDWWPKDPVHEGALHLTSFTVAEVQHALGEEASRIQVVGEGW